MGAAETKKERIVRLAEKQNWESRACLARAAGTSRELVRRVVNERELKVKKGCQAMRCNYSECCEDRELELLTTRYALLGKYCQPHALLQLPRHHDAFWLMPLGWHKRNAEGAKARRKHAMLEAGLLN